MWMLQPTLEGRIVRLEPLADRHREPLWEIAQDPSVWKWWTTDPSRDRQAWDAWFDGCLSAPQSGESFHFATVLVEGGAAVGSTSFCTVREEDRGVEIGWTWLSSSVWGSDVNTEAKYLQLKYAFETLQCIRVEWDTDAENHRSRAALSKLGAQMEGIWRDFHIRERDGSRRSSAIFSMLDTEWESVKHMLERRILTAEAG